MKYSDKIKHRGLLSSLSLSCFPNREGKGGQKRRCRRMFTARGRPTRDCIECGKARALPPYICIYMLYMCTHMSFLLAGGRRDRPEINRNCNGPIAQPFIQRRYNGLASCGVDQRPMDAGYRNNQAVL